MSLIDDGNQQQTPGGTEQPTSSPSVGQQGQQLSNVDALVKEVADLRKELRGIQKGTDKRFERQDADIKRILELKEQGLNESQIARELWIDRQMLGQDTSPQVPAGSGSARQAPDTGSAFSVADAIAALESYKLPTNDADVINLLRDRQLSKEKVDAYILGKMKPQPPANPADVVQSPATQRTTDKSVEALTEEYKQKMKAARGNRTELVRLRGEYAQKGVNVYGIDFS